MRQNAELISTLVVIFFVTCVGIAIAGGLKDSRSLEEITSRSIMDINQQNLEESAKDIVQNYLNAMINEHPAGWTPLVGFSIGRVDTSNPGDIRVSVIEQYKDHNEEFPPIDYSVVRVNDTYQVQKQVCVYEDSPNSPEKLIAHCTKKFSIQEDGKLTVRGVFH